MNSAVAAVMQPASLDALAFQWQAAKKAEQEANRARLEIEAKIVAMMPSDKDEGTTNESTESFKIKVERKLTRTVDVEVLALVAARLPEHVRDRLIRTKFEMDMREMRFLENNEPALYQIAAEAVTVKPAKPAVSITAIDKD